MLAPEHVPLPLTAWESFYVIVGTSAAALTGLMFVVIAVIADLESSGTSALAAFGTPNIIHFGASLLLSAMLSAPWPGLHGVALALDVTGVAGVAYTLVVIRRAVRQTGYTPVLEDWLWHGAFPLAAYAAVGVAGLTLQRATLPALFAVGGAAVLLVFIGIHNAWDTVTYITLQRIAQKRAARGEPGEGASSTDARPGAPHGGGHRGRRR